MNPLKHKARTLLPLFLILVSAAIAAAQTDIRSTFGQPSYEVSLQVLIGSDDAAAKTDVPRNLSAVVSQLRSSFAFPAYRLANTYLGRLGNNGSVEYKSVTNIFGKDPVGDTPSFLEWTLGGVRSTEGAGGRMKFMAQPFRFGARVPVHGLGQRDEAGKMSSAVVYESIGLTTNRMTMYENEPTLVGTLSLPETAGTMFLVLTVKPVE